MACARPSLTSSAQRRIEERRFFRIGVMAGSSMPTTSSAWTISMPAGPAGGRKLEAGELGLDPRPVADQEDRGAVLADGTHGSLHRTLRSEISTHGIHGDAQHDRLERRELPGAGG